MSRPEFHRKSRQLRNLLEDKSSGYERVTDEHRELLAKLGDSLPEPAKNESRLLALFSDANKIDKWLQAWAAEAQSMLKDMESGRDKATTVDAAPRASSSDVHTPQRSILQGVADFFVGSSSVERGENPARAADSNSDLNSTPPKKPSASGSPTQRSTISQPGTSQPGTSQPGTSQPGTSQPGTPSPGTPSPGTPSPNKPPSRAPTRQDGSGNYIPPTVEDENEHNEDSEHPPGTPPPGTPPPGTPPPGTPPPGTLPPSRARARQERSRNVPLMTSIESNGGDDAHNNSNNEDDPHEPAPVSGGDPAVGVNSRSQSAMARPPALPTPDEDSSRHHTLGQSGGGGAVGGYNRPQASGREEDADESSQEDDGTAFDPSIWEQRHAVDSTGYVERPPCFYSLGPATMPSQQKFPELWYEVCDPIDGAWKWSILKGKVRKNSLAFEIPSGEGSRVMLLNPSLYKSVSQDYNRVTKEQIPEVPYGDPRELVRFDLATQPPHQLCFAMGKGFQRKGDTFFIWYLDDGTKECWFSKKEVTDALGVAVVNDFLDQHVPSWNRKRVRIPRESSQVVPLSPSPTPTPAPPARFGLSQRQRDAREQHRTNSRQQSSTTLHNGLAREATREATTSLSPIYEQSLAGNVPPPSWYNPTRHVPGAPIAAPSVPWQPQQQPHAGQDLQASGQALSATFPYPFVPLPWAQDWEQQVHPPQWSHWTPPPPPVYSHPPPSYQTGDRTYRGSSHLPTPPWQMDYGRPRGNGSRQASEQPNGRPSQRSSSSPWR